VFDKKEDGMWLFMLEGGKGRRKRREEELTKYLEC
jgi:hypothetical protein